jgi:hypothetical protein
VRSSKREPDFQQKMLATNFSYGIEKDEKKLEANDHDHTKWTNPLEIRLPNAPSMKFFCVYGHGKDTEVGYFSLEGGICHLPQLPLPAFVLVWTAEEANDSSILTFTCIGTLEVNTNMMTPWRMQSNLNAHKSRAVKSQGPLWTYRCTNQVASITSIPIIR